MRKLLIASAMVAAFLAAPAVADQKTEAYAACKTQIKSVLGNDTNVTLRKIRSHRDVTKVRLQIRQPGVASETVSCIIGGETMAFQSADNQPLELAALVSTNAKTAIN